MADAVCYLFDRLDREIRSNFDCRIHQLEFVLFENERSSKIRRPSSSHYRVNIEKLAKMTKGFNHASCECFYPNTIMNEFSFLDYTYLKHVDLCVTEHNNSTYVLATYVGTVAL